MIAIRRTTTTLAIVALLSGTTAFAELLSTVDYDAIKDRIGADYKVGKTECAKLSGNTKDICMERTKGIERVARAELEYKYSGKGSDANHLAMAQADAAFAVSKELCDDMTGNAKDLCRTEAKTTHVKARADTTMNEKIDIAQQEAATDRRSADYKIAVQKCVGLSTDAMSACMNTAKTNFNKI